MKHETTINDYREKRDPDLELKLAKEAGVLPIGMRIKYKDLHCQRRVRKRETEKFGCPFDVVEGYLISEGEKKTFVPVVETYITMREASIYGYKFSKGGEQIVKQWRKNLLTEEITDIYEENDE